MVPIAKSKLQNFLLQHHEGPSEVNTLGMGSPPRQTIANFAATAGVVSASSPLLPKRDKKALESIKIPMNSAQSARPSKLTSETMKPPGTPRIKQSASRHQNDLDAGWSSAPPASLQSHLRHDENEGGLRERWEEQSNIHSLFSESEAARPASALAYHDGGKDDTQSDILVNRARPHTGRHTRKGSVSSDHFTRDRAQHRITGSSLAFGLTDGKIDLIPPPTNNFSTSMITHAPRNAMPEHPVSQQDPFGTTSGETSPRPQIEQEAGRAVSFLHSSFPHRGIETATGLTHVERAAFHRDAARKLAPEKYDGVTDPTYQQNFAQPQRLHSISDQRPTMYTRIEAHPVSDSDENDVLSQGDECEQQHRTPKGPNPKTAAENATVVFNPQKSVLPQKTQKTVILQDPGLEDSPMSRFVHQQSPSKKRRRDIDYEETVLQQMNFAELLSEPFDYDPARELNQSPAKPPADNLSDRLKFYSGKGEEAQTQVFTQMPVRDWEESGDWFLEQFGDIVKRMREARHAKRKMVEQFETEVLDREEIVRRKKEVIDRKLSKFRHDSEAMMEGKDLDD